MGENGFSRERTGFYGGERDFTGDNLGVRDGVEFNNPYHIVIGTVIRMILGKRRSMDPMAPWDSMRPMEIIGFLEEYRFLKREY